MIDIKKSRLLQISKKKNAINSVKHEVFYTASRHLGRHKNIPSKITLLTFTSGGAMHDDPRKAQYTCTQQCERLVQCKLVPLFTKCVRWASPHCTFFRE